ncbi:hypothetical protein VTI74DRAFT_8649 [Chaetomium olivicolor]
MWFVPVLSPLSASAISASLVKHGTSLFQRFGHQPHPQTCFAAHDQARGVIYQYNPCPYERRNQKVPLSPHPTPDFWSSHRLPRVAFVTLGRPTSALRDPTLPRFYNQSPNAGSGTRPFPSQIVSI